MFSFHRLLNKKVSYRKQIARQHSFSSNGTNIRSEFAFFASNASIVWGRDGPYRKFSHPRYLPKVWLLYAISRRQILRVQEVGDAGGRHVQGRV